MCEFINDPFLFLEVCSSLEHFPAIAEAGIRRVRFECAISWSKRSSDGSNLRHTVIVVTICSDRGKYLTTDIRSCVLAKPSESCLIHIEVLCMHPSQHEK